MNCLVIRRCSNAIARAINFRPFQGTQITSNLSTTSLRRNQDFRHSEDLAKERYDSRADENIDKKRARLLYQSRKRGMLENGVILASFANKFLDKLDPEQLDQYDRLINLPTNDWDIFYWATKTKPTPEEFETPVMQKLRDHINSKVSNKSSDSDNNQKLSNCNDDDADKKETKHEFMWNSNSKTKSILDNRRPDDILIKSAKKRYELDINPRDVNLTNHEEELFDNRTRKFNAKESMVYMTEWRKKLFVKRIKRTISSPVSLVNMNDSKEEIFTQKVDKKNIASEKLINNQLIDTKKDRTLKHHYFLQNLMSSNFTDDALYYDDEAEAWAELIWHRNYGSADSNIAPSLFLCSVCHEKLHCCDYGLKGYVPKELFANLQTQSESIKCQKCKFEDTYNASLGADIDGESYDTMLQELRNKSGSIVCLMVDLTDFPGSILENIRDLIGDKHRLLIVGNKLDLLPSDGPHMIDRVIESLKSNLNRLRTRDENLNISEVLVLSARTGFGVENLVTKLLDLSSTKPRDIYLLGCSNTGKSTLFNALVQSDLSAVRQGDLMSRISQYECPGTGKNLLRFPINNAEGWEVELKNRRSERTTRNTAVYERSLKSTTEIRQAMMPHMTMLVDRLEFPPDSSTTSVELKNHHQSSGESEDSLRLTDDHPLAQITERENFSATEENFPHHAFLHHTASVKSPGQIHDLLTNHEKLEVFPSETIIPRKYSIRPLNSIFVAGLARLDLLTANSNVIITMFASRYLPIHVVPTRKADHFYNTFLGSPYLGVPFGDEERLRAWPGLKCPKGGGEYLIRSNNWDTGAADIVLSSVGWALVSILPDQDCILKAYTPEGRGIYLRKIPLLPFARKNIKSGKKIRDTPLFVNPNYTIERTIPSQVS